MRWLLVDTETTGISVNDKVCEMAYVEIDDAFNVIRSGNSLINPGIPIHYSASSINGITDVMVKDAPTLDDYMLSEGSPLQGEVTLIAHNLDFDFRFLKAYTDDGVGKLCTLKCARVLYPDAANHKQGTLAAMLGIQVAREKAHSADGDLDVLMFIIKHLCEKKGVALPGLLEVQCEARRNTTFPFGKHKGKKPSEVDVGYCQWALKTLENLDADLRAALEARIKPQANR